MTIGICDTNNLYTCWPRPNKDTRISAVKHSETWFWLYYKTNMKVWSDTNVRQSDLAKEKHWSFRDESPSIVQGTIQKCQFHILLSESWYCKYFICSCNLAIPANIHPEILYMIDKSLHIGYLFGVLCLWYIYILVGGLDINFIFPYIGLLIIPIDFHIFQRAETTNQYIHIYMYIYII